MLPNPLRSARYLSLFSGVLAIASLASSATAQTDTLRFGGAPVELTLGAVSDRTLRIELSPVDEQGRARNPEPNPELVPLTVTGEHRVRELTHEREFRSGRFRVVVRPRPFTVLVCRADGKMIQELIFEEGGETGSISFRVGAPVLGLGEGGDQFDRRGFDHPLINGQRYKLGEFGTRVFSPFIIGTEGWALFVSSPYGGVDLRGERGAFLPQRGAMAGAAEVFVTDVREPSDAMREFARLTGPGAMPPKWALGFMQSHRTLSGESNILAEARLFRERNLPLDTFIFLGTGFCPAGWNFSHDSFAFNTNVFVRSPAEVIRDLHALNVHVALHVVPQDPRSRDARLLYPSLHGSIPPAPGDTLDALHIQTYWKRHGELFAAGVDGWWPDEGDWFDIASRLERHRMYYEGPLSEKPNVRPWNLQRNGCPGIARYGGWIWSGDVDSSWRTLAAQVKVGLNSSLSVSPFWGTDIGGFNPGTNREYTGELYVRWFQFAAFCPSFRSHGRTWQLHTPWGWNTGETGPIESRPVPDPSELTNAAVEPVCRQYLNLRYQLMPYTYAITREACDNGMPLMRALWLHYPDDPEAVGLGDEYLWGRDLLIAPVTEKAATSRRVYLPAGKWYDWWTGEKLDGKRRVDRPVDLATMPLYVRAGAIVPLDPIRQYTGQPVTAPTTLRVYPGADGVFTFYDDDGTSMGYRDGSDAKTVWLKIRWEDAPRRLSIAMDGRMRKWAGGTRYFAIEAIGSKAAPKIIEFTGKPVVVNP